MEEIYNSVLDTMDHKERVRSLLYTFSVLLKIRGVNHDNSKLGDFEKPYFDELTPKLKNLEYGSDKYKESLSELQVALKHHYENNSHHPEHYENGIDGFDLLDLCEMFFDWTAATERTKDGDILKSIEINKNRFNMSDQLVNIFNNTVKTLKNDE